MQLGSKRRFFVFFITTVLLLGSLAFPESEGAKRTRATDPDLTVGDLWFNHTSSKVNCRVTNLGLPFQGPFTLNLTMNGYLFYQEVVDWIPEWDVANVTFPQSYPWRTLSVTVEVEIYYHLGGVDGNLSNNKRVERWEQNLPDLVIKAFYRDPEKGNAVAIIENIGDVRTTGFFYVSLFLENISEPWEMVFDPLPPGNTTKVNFPWVWDRNQRPTVNISLKVDVTLDVPEKNEDNNYHNVTWKARSPLYFVMEPKVQYIGRTNATIICETSVPTTFNLEYGKTSKYGKTVETRQLSTYHSIEIKALEPDTGYNYRLELSSFGWSISKKDYLTTEKAEEGNPFEFNFLGSLIFNETRDLPIPMTMPTDQRIKKFDLYFNGGLVGSFSDIEKRGLDRLTIKRDDQFFKICLNYNEALANIKVVATDDTGRTASAETTMAFGEHYITRYPRVDLTTLPGVYSGNVALSARCTDPKGITDVVWSVDGTVIRRQTPILSDTTFFYASADWNSPDFPDGVRTVRIAVNNTEGNTTTIGTYVSIDNFLYTGDADVRLGRGNILRSGSIITVPFTVGNLGTEAASDIEIIDLIKGYVPIDPSTSSRRYSGDGRIWEARIEIPWLGPGETIDVSYQCIPALLSEEDEHVIGYALNYPDHPGTERVSTICFYERGDGHVSYIWARNIPALMFVGDGHPDTGAENAIGYASYLMLTNPYRLEDLIGEYDTNRLLKKGAELTSKKNGIMGILLEGYRGPFYTAESVRTNILEWASRMNPIFSMAGYLAILGENDIVPAWYYDDVVEFTDAGWVDVRLSDHGYSSLDGDEVPELVVGRMIGDSYGEMLTQIQTSINEENGVVVNDPHGSALLMAGAGNGVISFKEYLRYLEVGLMGRMDTVHMVDKSSVLRTELTDITFRDNGNLVSAGDVDGDGLDEIVALDPPMGRFQILEPRTGNLDNIYVSPFYGDRILVGDVVPDSMDRDELIVLSHDIRDNGIARYYEEDGDLIDTVSLPWFEGEGICMADDDGDGLDDFIIASYELDLICIFDETGRLRRTTGGPEIDPDQRIAVGDLDRDGAMDYIIADHQDDIVRVCRGGGRSIINIPVLGLDSEDAFSVGPYAGNGTDKIVIVHPEWEGILEIGWLEYDTIAGSWVGKISGDFLTDPRSTCAAIVGNFEAGGRLEEVALIRSGSIGNVDILDLEEVTLRYQTLVDPLMDERDLLVYSDHGWEEGWSGLYDFTNTSTWGMSSWYHRPVIYSAACSTGNYGSTDDSMALACLRNGAGLFIGATGGSQIPENNLAMNFLTEYASGYSAGIALRNHKQRLMRGDFDIHDSLARKWALEYQLFGDPAFGVSPGASPGRGNPLDMTRASSSNEVKVPDPVFLAGEGGKEAMIPGGCRYSVEGYPSIPYYTVEIDLPEGTTVSSANISMDEVWTYLEDISLRPNPGSEIADEGSPGTRAAETIDPEDTWYPGMEMGWKVRSGPMGARSLVVTFFPMQYDLSSERVRFSANWTVRYETVGVTVELSDLKGPGSPVEMGTNASFSVTLMPVGEGGRVGVSQWIEDSSGIMVAELGASVYDINISTHLSEEWGHQGKAAGSYAYFVEVRDGEGNLIDSGRVLFMIGSPSVEIEDLTVEPKVFSNGKVNVGVKFSNTGEASIPGNVTISLLDDEWELIRKFETNITLVSGGSVPMIATFDMSGYVGDVYFIRARFQSNIVTVSDTVQITRSGYVPPVVPSYSLSIEYTVSPVNITDMDKVWINGTVTRSDGLGMGGIGIGAMIGNGSVHRSLETGGNGTFSLQFDPLEAGTYNVTLRSLAGVLEATETFTLSIIETIPGDDDDDDDIVDDDIVDDDVVDDDIVDDDVVDDDITDDDEKNTNWSLIAGIIVGIVFLVLVLIFIVLLVKRSQEVVMDWDEE
ncbi:MAG: hypothetical protein JXA22_06995 [Candidatus Thermoplasmatota archaeon]|nr:hypothetical protein [Candidatus Thermoplasmatota archaeon]